MCIKNACFISYPHGQGNLVNSFIMQLKQALEDYLGPLLREPVYMDEHRLNPGYNFNEALGKAICESVCMIVVFSPRYMDSDYCLREFLAMEHIEEKRKQMLGQRFDRTRRMIIPIVIRGDQEDLPDKIKQIQYCDLSKFLLAGIKIAKKLEANKLIDNIAREIYEHYKSLKELDSKGLNEDCDSFVLPSEQDARVSWEIRVTKSIGFPGRDIS